MVSWFLLSFSSMFYMITSGVNGRFLQGSELQMFFTPANGVIVVKETQGTNAN